MRDYRIASIHEMRVEDTDGSEYVVVRFMLACTCGCGVYAKVDLDVDLIAARMFTPQGLKDELDIYIEALEATHE
jgi:hypothetical protein